MRYKKFIRTYFNFSQKERKGLVVLLGIISILIILKICMHTSITTKNVDFSMLEDSIDNFLSYQHYAPEDIEYFYFDPNTASSEDFHKLGLSPKSINAILESREKGYIFYKPEDLKKVRNLSEIEYEQISQYIDIQAGKKNEPRAEEYNKSQVTESGKHTIRYFVFDPNTVEKEELIALGFKQNQIRNLLKFREKGGRFKHTEDLKKIYGIGDYDFERLKDYIKIKINESKINNESEYKDIKIELNQASAEDLQEIIGIGKTYSTRIVKYRKLLGGYSKKEQLLEVYGFSEEAYSSIKDYIYIDATHINKININTADFKKLVSHPYINKDDAIKILNYRKFAKKISSIEELNKEKALSEDLIERISPYLTID